MPLTFPIIALPSHQVPRHRTTERSLIGFRQKRRLRIPSKGTLHDILNYQLSFMTRINTAKSKARTVSSVRRTSDLHWVCRGSSLVPSQRRHTLNTHFSIYRAPGGRFSFPRHSSSQKLSTLTESQVSIPRS